MGCSNGTGNTNKALTLSNCDETTGLCNICQHQPAIFGANCIGSIYVLVKDITPTVDCNHQFFTPCNGWHSMQTFDPNSLSHSWQLINNSTRLRQYMFYAPYKNSFYVTPKTTAIWSYASNVTELKGVYQYGTTWPTISNSFNCLGSSQLIGAGLGLCIVQHH